MSNYHPHHPHHPRNTCHLRSHHGVHRQRSSSWSDWPEDLLTARFHPDVIETKDVLVIGNGPSSITLSYILSGRWPYYRGGQLGGSSGDLKHDSSDSGNSSDSGHSEDQKNDDDDHKDITYEPHPIDFLHDRLVHQGADKSLVESDLEMLSSGLSGRSLNRVSVLFDQLQNPNTDFGTRQPSTLEWRYKPDRAIDHLVLGTGLPGGLWYSLRKSKTILTVSRQKWMQLPEMDIPPELDEDGDASTSADYGRVSFDHIAQYYRSYVDHFNLTKYFRNHTRVIRVDWCPGLKCWIVDAITKRCLPKSCVPLAQSSNSNGFLRHLRCLTKLRCSQKEYKLVRTRFLAKSVVLATGANAAHPSMLNVPGEAAPFVIHSLDQLDSVLRMSSGTERISRPLGTSSLDGTGSSASSGPIILIIGSGLSSADALAMIAAANASQVTPASGAPFRAIHIFRRSIQDRNLIFNQLSNENLYPEYTKVFKRMKSSIKSPRCIRCFLRSGSTYQAYDRCLLDQVNPGPVRSATLEFLDQADFESPERTPSSKSICVDCDQPLWNETSFPVSLVLVLIGSKPQLDFLPSHMVAKLGLIPNSPIDIRQNPIKINTITHEAMAVKNLYAIGPLVGDNFVRFVQGGALAVAADLNQKKMDQKKTVDQNGHCLI